LQKRANTSRKVKREADRIKREDGIKKCSKCLVLKPFDSFDKHPTSKDGHKFVCIECNRKTVLLNKFDYKEDLDDESLVNELLEKTKKECSTCHVLKLFDCFRVSSGNRKDGRVAICIDCENIEEKKCPHCLEVKNIAEFSKGMSVCRICSNKTTKAYKEKRKLEGPSITITEKICKGCKILKSVDNFWKSGTSKDGYHSKCSTCKKNDDKNRKMAITS
jgi:hypothetical protein